MSIAALEGESEFSGEEDSAALPHSRMLAMPESDLEMTAVLFRAAERQGLKWKPPPCPEPSRLEDWFLSVACTGSQRPTLVPFFPEVHEGLTSSWTAPFTARNRPASSSSLTTLRRCVCGLWRSCLRLTRYGVTAGPPAKALKDLHKSGHDPEVLKELRTATDLTLRATKVTASSLGLSCPHLWSRSATSGCVWSTWGTKFGSSRPPCPRPASSATQSRTWPRSSWLHRSRLRRSNTSCPGRQLLPPPVRQLQRPCLLVVKAGPLRPPLLPRCICNSIGRPPRPSRPPSNLAVSGRARGPRTGDPEREGTALREMVNAPLPPPEEGRVKNILFTKISTIEQFFLSLGPKRTRRVMDGPHSSFSGRFNSIIKGPTHAPSAQPWNGIWEPG